MSATVIRDVRIFDGEGIVPRGSVLVRDGLIACVGQVDVPGDAQVIEGEGRTLLPGLIDAHTHAFPGKLEQAVRFGVTTELDMFSVPSILRQVRAEAAKPYAADLRTSGTGATAPGGHPSQFMAEVFGAFPMLSSAEDSVPFVRDRVAEGADYLKILIEDGSAMGMPLPCLDAATVQALVEAAHAQGLLAVAHATTQAGAELAVAAGIDGLTHVFLADSEVDRLAARLAEARVFVTATLALFESLDDQAGTSLAADERIGARLSPELRAAVGHTPPGFSSVPGLAVHTAETTAALHRAGVVMLAGTDANDGPHGAFPVVHGASLHRELECLTMAGLTPVQALAAATSVPAKCYGLDDRGRIAPGLRADLLLVEGDPTQDITATRSIAGVWRQGRSVPYATAWGLT
ncbi:amidohydrolase family protein [Nonomuraea indica]|uniref:Amidohydrolase family protein n=1 Tax=Nonomuraea indica TaxID=1581193 RepID=A0ABW8ABJ4_9ACTN